MWWKPGERRGPEARLPAPGERRKGAPRAVTRQMPSSGSLNHRPIKSEPSTAGAGREGGRGVVGGESGRAAKWKRGSGKWSRVSHTRVAPVCTTYTWEQR